MQGPPKRIPGAKVAGALTEIIETRQLKRPYTLFRHIATRTGVNSTTVMRYHTGYLRSAPAEVYACIHEILLRIRGGHALPFETLANRARRPRRAATRVPAALIRQGLEDVRTSLGLAERQILYRYLGGRVGLHPTTVLRYCRGDLETAPVVLIAELELLRQQIVDGETVVFERSRDGVPVVMRERTRSLLENLPMERGVDRDPSVHRHLDRWLKLPPGTTRRICHEQGPRFVSADVHRIIEDFVRGVEYDPVRTYRRGDRIRHHLFGLGTVVEKIHKNKVRVEFLGGRRVILSESVVEDPYRHQRHGGGGTLKGHRWKGCSTRAR